ncbi:MAG: hypothetical protein WBW16_00070 [Bacteroidota bacterium]
MNDLLLDLYAHQAWADAEHWRAFEAKPGALHKTLQFATGSTTITSRSGLFCPSSGEIHSPSPDWKISPT